MKKIKSKDEKILVSKKTKILRIVLLLFILVWAFIVFNFSSQNGEESSGLSRRVVEFFIKEEELVDKIEPYVRKFAHFSEYALGGTLFLSLFYTYNWTDEKKMCVSILLGIWYAATDEIHQLMVPARNGNIADVLIDTLGFATGVCVMLFIIKVVLILLQRKKKINKEKV